MIRVADQIVVDRPVAVVWEFLMDPANQRRWQTSVVATRREPEAPTALGTRYVETRRLLGRKFAMTFEVIRFDPPRHSAIELVGGPIRGGAGYHLEPVEGGTRVTFSARLDTRGLFRVGEPVLKGFFKGELRTYLRNLKNLVESPTSV